MPGTLKVLVFSPYALGSPPYEHELEIMQNHLDAGDEVAVAVCNAAMPACDINPSHDPYWCSRCVGRRIFGLAQLSKPVRQIPIIEFKGLDWEGSQTVPRRFASLEALQSFRIDNFELGQAALSSVVGAMREPKPDLTDPAISQLAYRFLLSAFQVYRSLIHLLDQEHFDRVYALDSQLAVLRAVLRACQFEGIECHTHEQTDNFDATTACKGVYRSIELRETGFFAEAADYLSKRPKLRKALRSLCAGLNSAVLGGSPF